MSLHPAYRDQELEAVRQSAVALRLDAQKRMTVSLQNIAVSFQKTKEPKLIILRALYKIQLLSTNQSYCSINHIAVFSRLNWFTL